MSIAEKLQTIAENEQKVYDAGYAAGYDEGLTLFVRKHLEAKKETGLFEYAFCGWNARMIDAIPSGTHNFQGSDAINTFAHTKLPERFERGDIKFVSFGSNLTEMFSCSNIINLGYPLIVTSARNASYMFHYCENLFSIAIDFGEDLERIDYAFYGCGNLEELRLSDQDLDIYSKIGCNGLNLQWSPKLSYDSLISVLYALADKSDDNSGTVWKVTLGSTNLAKLGEAELSIAWNKGWEVI